MPGEKQKSEQQKSPVEKPKPEYLRLLEEQRRQRFLDFVLEGEKPDVRESDRKTKPSKRGLSLGQKFLIGAGLGLAVATGMGVAHGDTIYLERSRTWEESAIVENVVITEETPDSVKFYIPGTEDRPLTFDRTYIRRIEKTPTIVQPSTQKEVETRYADAKSKYDGAIREITLDKWIRRLPFIAFLLPIIYVLYWFITYTADIIYKILERFPGYWLRRADKYVNKSNWEAVTNIGDRLLEKTGRKDLAKTLWSRAARGYATKKDWNGVELIGDRFERIRDIGKAENLWLGAANGYAEQNNWSRITSIGDKFERIRDTDQAKQLWSRAADGYTEQNNWQGIASIGDRFEKIGEIDQAKALWSRAAEGSEKSYSSYDLKVAIESYKKIGDTAKVQELEPKYRAAKEREEREEAERRRKEEERRSVSGESESSIGYLNGEPEYRPGECWPGME